MRWMIATLATWVTVPLAIADGEGIESTLQGAAATTPASQQPATPYAAVPAVPPPAITGDVADLSSNHVRYGRVGARELGASAGLAIAQDIRALNFSPSIGVFLTDKFEVSGILDVSYFKAGASDATVWSALAEPSFHVPVNESMYGFFGMGVGASYVSELGTGMAVAPRVGMDVVVGGSGMLRPSLSYQYTTHDASSKTDVNGNTDVTLVAVSSALRFNIGYTRVW